MSILETDVVRCDSKCAEVRTWNTWPKTTFMPWSARWPSNTKMPWKRFDATSTRKERQELVLSGPQLSSNETEEMRWVLCRHICQFVHLFFVNEDPASLLSEAEGRGKMCAAFFVKLPRYIKPGWHATIPDRVNTPTRCIAEMCSQYCIKC